MNKKTKYFFIFTLFLFILFSSIVIYILNYETTTKNMLKNKAIFVSLVGLPDLAISTEVGYIRHRSLSDTKSIFTDGPEHLEYFTSTFAISYKERKND